MKNILLLLLAVGFVSTKALAGEAEATKAFINNYGVSCDSRYTDAYADGSEKPETHVINYLETAYEEGRQIQVKLYIYNCYSGAYNFSSMFIFENEYNEISLLSFAEPTYDVIYSPAVEDPATVFYGENVNVDSITVTGLNATQLLVNASFDPVTQTITNFAKFRGMGDASASGVWAFKNGHFILKRYEVDSSYDGQMNPLVLIDYP